MPYSRKQLKKLYPEADENYLMLMLDGKIHSCNYIHARKKEIYDEFDKYYVLIYNVFANYLVKKNRDYFTTKDFKNINDVLRKRISRILTKFYLWSAKHFISSVSEFYNYKLMYNLWMFETVEEDIIAGEMSSKKFDSKKVSSLIDRKQYGYGYIDRIEKSIDLSEKEITSIVRGITTKNGSTLKDVEKLMDRRLRKCVAGNVANAESISLEDIDSFVEDEIYESVDANSAFGGNWVRVEILDSKTCLVCASIDGRVSKRRYGSIHPHCRGIDVPCSLSGSRVERAKEKLNRESKRSKNFDKWFNKLSEKDKRRVLGKKKYLKYQSGKINIHQLVKGIRVDGISKVKQVNIPKSIKDNPVLISTRQLKSEYSRLPVKKIDKISTMKEYNAYERYLNKKELTYRNLNITDLRKAGIKRKSLLDEIYRERKKLKSILKAIHV